MVRISPFLSTRVSALIILVSLSIGLMAQEADISGHIVDEEGTPLIGATVRVLGSVIGTTSDVDGHYEIGVPPGRIRLVYTYLGYRDLDTVVVVRSIDRDLELDVVMEFSAIEAGPEVIVIGSRASKQAQALRLQQSALSAQTIIHSELFNKYPDVTIAETVSRMPGVSIIRGIGEGQIVQVRGLPEQYTAVALNGQRLPTIQAEADQEGTLDLIQSNLVDEVRVIKSRTGDMDGDAIGGTVDFRIRQPQRKFETLVQAGVGNNFGFDGNPGQSTGVTQLAGVLNSEITDEKIYALFAGSYLRQGRGTQQTIYDYEQDSEELFAARPADIDRQVERRGFVGAVEFRPSIYNRLKIAYNLSRTREDITHRQLFARNLSGGNATLDRRTAAWEKERQLELVSLEGENNFPSTRIDYALSFSQTREDLDNRLSAISGSSFDGSTFDRRTTAGLRRSRATSTLNDEMLPGALLTQNNVSLDEDVVIMSFNITRYLNKAKTGYLRAGVRYRSKDRSYGFLLANGDVDRQGTLLEPGAFNDVPEEPIVEDVPDLNSEAERYSASQRIRAAYLMYAANFSSRFSMSAGLRYEKLEIETADFFLGQVDFSLLNEDLFPSLNLTYRARRERQVRLSYYQAVARPNYATFIGPGRLPLIALDEFTRGNRAIGVTRSNNVDLTFERYGRRDGLISFGLYYKRLDNPTLRNSITDYSGVVPVYETQLINVADANLAGFELGFYQNLGFIGTNSAWRHLNLNGTYNYNALSTETNRFDVSDFTLAQAPRQTANLSFVYSNPKTRLNLVTAVNYRDRIFDRLLDGRAVYKNSLFSLDLSADYRFYKDFTIYARANNLTDHPIREFFGVPGDDNALLRSSARYGAWGVIGVRFQPR